MVLADVFGPDIFLVLIALFCSIVVPIWAIADAASHSAPAFFGARSNKTAWIAVVVVALLLASGSFWGASTCSSRGRRSVGTITLAVETPGTPAVEPAFFSGSAVLADETEERRLCLPSGSARRTQF